MSTPKKLYELRAEGDKRVKGNRSWIYTKRGGRPSITTMRWLNKGRAALLFQEKGENSFHRTKISEQRKKIQRVTGVENLRFLLWAISKETKEKNSWN